MSPRSRGTRSASTRGRWAQAPTPYSTLVRPCIDHLAEPGLRLSRSFQALRASTRALSLHIEDPFTSPGPGRGLVRGR